MLTVAVTNQKGGVGKTGVAVGLAGCLVDRGYRVLVVDLEPQATATEWLGARPAATKGHLPEDLYGPPLLEALLHGKPLGAYESKSGVDIVPSGNQLNGFEIEAAMSKPAGERELLLRRCVEQLPPDRWDVVLIDCPPTLGLLTTNALAAADQVLMPVKLDSASRTPLVRLYQAAVEIHNTVNPRLELTGIVGTFHEKTRNHQEDVFEWLKDQFGDASDLVFDTPIRKSPHVAESHGAQLPVCHYIREEGIRQSVARDDFEAFTDAFIEAAELAPPAAKSERRIANG